MVARRKESSRYGSESNSLHYDLLERDNDAYLAGLHTQVRLCFFCVMSVTA